MNLYQKLISFYDNFFFQKKIKEIMNDDFYFIQIGACDGKQFDPIYKQVTSNQLAGLLVEPIPHLFNKLQKNYTNNVNLAFENSAITTYDGNIQMFTITEEGLKVLPSWAIGISSIHDDKNGIGEKYWNEHQEKHPDKDKVNFELIKKHRIKLDVNALTLSSLYSKHQINKVDLMVLDTEGHEYSILNQLKDLNTLPKLIRFEISNIKNEYGDITNLLCELGYKYKSINTHDCIAWL